MKPKPGLGCVKSALKVLAIHSKKEDKVERVKSLVGKSFVVRKQGDVRRRIKSTRTL